MSKTLDERLLDVAAKRGEGKAAAAMRPIREAAHPGTEVKLGEKTHYWYQLCDAMQQGLTARYTQEIHERLSKAAVSMLVARIDEVSK